MRRTSAIVGIIAALTMANTGTGHDTEPGFAVTHTIEIKGDVRVEPLSGSMAISTNQSGSKKIEIKDDAVVNGDA